MSFARRALVGLPILGALALGSQALIRRYVIHGKPERTWPSRVEFEQMDDAAVNEYLASRGFEVRVAESASVAE